MLDDKTREALLDALEDLDAAWKFDAARGLHDGIGGAEYERVSPVPRLRALLAPLPNTTTYYVSIDAAGALMVDDDEPDVEKVIRERVIAGLREFLVDVSPVRLEITAEGV